MEGHEDSYPFTGTGRAPVHQDSRMVSAAGPTDWKPSLEKALQRQYIPVVMLGTPLLRPP